MESTGIYMLPIIGVIGQDFKYSDVLMHLNSAKNSQFIKLIIDSPGGYISEGEKIKQALIDSKKVMFATNSGDVASYAVEFFVIAPKQNRIYDPSKGVFLIHMPFVTPEDGVYGTADEIENIAKELKRIQNDIVKGYSKATGTDISILEGFMNENIPLTPDQVESLGFATVIKRDELKAVAYYNNNLKMNAEEIKTKIGVLETLMNKVLNFIKPKNLMIQDVNGKEIDFGDAIKTQEEIKVGVTANIDGNPAAGDYTLADGTIYKFDAGALIEIILPTGDENEVEVLKAENENLKAEIEASKNEASTVKSEFSNFKINAEKQLKEVKSAFETFKSQFSTGDVPPNTPGSGNAGSRKAFKS